MIKALWLEFWPFARWQLEYGATAWQMLRDFVRGLDLADEFGMFRTPKAGKTANYTAIATTLLDTARWLSHGQMIGHAEANTIGLEVEYMDPRSEPWASFWQLYCYQRLEVKDKHKIFESDFVSLLFDE